MRTLRFHEFGTPEVLQIQDISRPTIQADEVLIEVYAAGLNPSDVKNVQGAMSHTNPQTKGEHENEGSSLRTSTAQYH